jgi:chromosome condensin MukBEF complex kleisin-like MukF subunit
MNNDKFVRLETLRDVEIALLDAQLDGKIIPEIVFEILKNVEDREYPTLPSEVVNELTEHGQD